jgi:hypothetical protein
MNQWQPTRRAEGIEEVMVEPVRDGTFFLHSRGEQSSGDNWVENVDDLNHWLRDYGLI